MKQKMISLKDSFLFLTQNESTVDQLTLIVNDEVYKIGCNVSLSEEIRSKKSFLQNYWKKNRVDSQVIRDYQDRGELPRNFAILNNGKEFCLQSCFLEKDIEGRPMAFSFWTNEKEYDSILKKLKEYADRANRTLNEDELSLIPSLLRKIEAEKKEEKKKQENLVKGATILFILCGGFWKCWEKYQKSKQHACFYGDKKLFDLYSQKLTPKSKTQFYGDGEEHQINRENTLWFIFDGEKYQTNTSYRSDINRILINRIRFLSKDNMANKLQIIVVSTINMDSTAIKELILSSIGDEQSTSIELSFRYEVF